MSVYRNLGLRTDLQGDDEVLRQLKRIEETGSTAALNLRTGYLAVSQAIRDVGAVLRPVIGYMEEAAKAAQIEEQSMLRRNAALQQSGQYTAKMVEQLEAQAAAYLQNYGIADDYTRSVQAQLALNANFGDSLDEATQALIQYAEVTGKDAVESAAKFAKFYIGQTDSIKGSTIEVDKNTSSLDRLKIALDQTAAGAQILDDKAETVAGSVNIWNAALGELAETIGMREGATSPDMAFAINVLADAVFKLNNNLQGDGGLAFAETLLAVAEAAVVTGGAIEDLMNRVNRKEPRYSLFGAPLTADDYDIFRKNLQEDMNGGPPNTLFTDDMLESIRAGRKELQDRRNFVGPRQPTNPNYLPIPGESGVPGAGSFIEGLGLPKHTRDGMDTGGFPAGFRPQNTELWAAAGTIVGRAAADQFAANVAESTRLIPDLSQDGTVGMDLRYHPIVDRRYSLTKEKAQKANFYRDARAGFDDQGWGQVGASLLRGGLSGALSQAGSIAGAGALSGFGPLGGLLGGFAGDLAGDLLGGVGKFLGLGGGKGDSRGSTPSLPVFTEDARTHRLLTNIVNSSQLNRLRGGGGVDSITNDYRAQRGRAGLV